jgi:hypothetical protein
VTADRLCLSSDGLARTKKHVKIREKGGPQLPAFDEARRRGFTRWTETVEDKYLMRRVGWRTRG